MRRSALRFQIKLYSFLISIVVVFFSQRIVSAGYEEGLAAYKRGDYATALREFRPSATKGHEVAQFYLGLMYYAGQGVTRDYKEALRWSRKAAGKEHPLAQFMLGVMYSRGEGVPQDYKQAAHWYRQAAEQGEARAQYNLASMYENGQGVSQDYVRAHLWLSLAATGGGRKAVKSRDTLEKRMTPSQLEEAKRLAREWKPNKSK